MIKKTKKQMGSGLADSVPFNCYVRCKESYEYVIPIIGPIEETSDFLEAVAMIEMAEEKDTVILKINSPGGSLAAVDYLLQALAQCNAHIHAECTGELMSASSLIMEYVDSFTISDNTSVLIHNQVFGEFGKHYDIIQAVTHADHMNKKLLDRYYKYMFSDDEMTQLYEGKQFWMDNESYLERFERRRKILMEERGEQCSCPSCQSQQQLPLPECKEIENNA